MRYAEYKQRTAGMNKQALLGELLDTATELPNIFMETLQNGSVLLLAGAGLLGGGIGYTAAKLTAHGKQDLKTVKKEYENERLKADLGYLSAKTRSEYEQFQNQNKPQSARVIN